MRKQLSGLIASAMLATTLLASPQAATAQADAVIVGGAIFANSAYAHGYRAGIYAPSHGAPGYTMPRPAPVYSNYVLPYYDYGPIYYQSPQYLRRVYRHRPVRNLGAPLVYSQPHSGGFYAY